MIRMLGKESDCMAALFISMRETLLKYVVNANPEK